jgi:hypothetical protein
MFQFSGSGHKLGAASSGQTAGGMGSWLGGASSSANASAAPVDRETMAARRLAAINAQAQNASGSQDSGV